MINSPILLLLLFFQFVVVLLQEDDTYEKRGPHEAYKELFDFTSCIIYAEERNKTKCKKN